MVKYGKQRKLTLNRIFKVASTRNKPFLVGEKKSVRSFKFCNETKLMKYGSTNCSTVITGYSNITHDEGIFTRNLHSHII